MNILLVEDSLITAEYTAFALRSIGCEVTIAFDGLEALEKLNQLKSKLDIIILDIEMPIVDGFSVLKKLKEKYNDQLPFVCAFSTLINEKNFKEHGFDHYLSKPTNNQELILLIKKIKNKTNKN